METKIGRRLAGLALAAATAAVGMAMAAPVEASAAPASCDLTITPIQGTGDLWWLKVTCQPKSPHDQMFYVNIWGDDPSSDDLLRGPIYTQSGHTFERRVNSEFLNEDIGGDEIYVGVWFRTSSGSRYGVPTNVVHGNWG